MSFDDTFTLVTGRRHRRNPLKKPRDCISEQKKLQGEEDIDISVPVVLRRIEDCKKNLFPSQFCECIFDILFSELSLVVSKAVPDIICYGLGHFTECNIARYQLALLLLFQEKFNAVVYVHDPIFYACEVNILRQFSFFVILENEEGKRLIKHGKQTLLYSPHCPRQLINNFLWRNWGLSLNQCIVVGNSFSSIIEQHVLSDTSSISYIKKIQPYTNEHVLRNNFVFSDVFNNISIHMFPEDKLGAQEPSFWTEDCEEPVYPDKDTEFIRDLK